MTYRNIISAIPAFQKLVEQAVPLPLAYRISKMARKINDEMEFFRKQDEEIRKKHEDLQSPECVKEFNDLLDFNVEWNFEPITINLSEHILLSSSDIDSLSGFVIFDDKKHS